MSEPNRATISLYVRGAQPLCRFLMAAPQQLFEPLSRALKNGELTEKKPRERSGFDVPELPASRACRMTHRHAIPPP
jgi:hypothetical protein